MAWGGENVLLRLGCRKGLDIIFLILLLIIIINLSLFYNMKRNIDISVVFITVKDLFYFCRVVGAQL